MTEAMEVVRLFDGGRPEVLEIGGDPTRQWSAADALADAYAIYSVGSLSFA